ncbi:MAG: hypothetical protein LBU39_01295 [Desulfobulbaceae bacterium]|jgi:tetratricopeptide (TPR) repeat protein|nr:hypothetical protein [Desulfobulbaceae bacterium]
MNTAIKGEKRSGRGAVSARMALCAALALLIPAFFCLWLTVPRFAYQNGLEALRQKDWARARTHLLKAAKTYGLDVDTPGAPWYVPNGDAKPLYKALGESFLAEAAALSDAAAVFAALCCAERYFRGALRLQTLDVSAQTGLARTMAALERGWPYFEPNKKNPYDAAPEFERLLWLRPNGIEAHFLFIRYLNGTGKDDQRLARLARHLTEIYPQAADSLRQDLATRRDWNEKLEPAIIAGLRAAINANYQSSTARRALANLAIERGDFVAAIDELQRALALDAANKKKTSGVWLDYSRLAMLNSRLGLVEAATEAAINSLRLAGNRESALRELWRIYRDNKQFRAFLTMLTLAEDRVRLPEARRIVRASCLVELGDAELAQSSLLLVKDPNYQPEALRFVAELARKKKDWDAMELAAQRASALEPKNIANFYLFAQSLRAQKKYRQAVEEMDKAIAAARKEDPSLYNFRAWNRWDLHRLEDARADWLKAIQLAPENAYFYRSLAMTYEKEGARLQAVATMKKALALAPGNAEFMNKLLELQGKHQK